jgi:flagellar motor protein MotB
MPYRRWFRREQAANPFVVLSDVSIVLILILILYFSVLFYVTRQGAAGLQRQIETLKGANIDLAQRVQDLQGANARLREDLTIANKKLAQRSETIENYKQFVKGILEEPSLAPHRSQITSYEPPGDIQIFYFGQEVLFNPSEFQLLGKGQSILGAFDQVLGPRLVEGERQFGFYPEIQIQGHTDTDPADNWNLSMQRALAVVKEFSAHQRLRQHYLSAAGYSCHRPRFQPADYGPNQDRNRRIEVRLVYSQEFVGGQPYACDCY